MGSGGRVGTLQPRFASTSPTPPNAASVMRTLKPRKPFIETWKCARKPCPRTLKPLPLTSTKEDKRKVGRPKKKGVTPIPQQFKTFATVEGVKLASVKPYTFRPRHKQSNRKIVTVTKMPKVTTTPQPPKKTSTTPSTTTVPKSTKSVTRKATFAPKASTSPTPTTVLPSTTTKTAFVTEVTKRRDKRPEVVTKRIPTPLNVIRITPFTTQEPQTLRPETSSPLSINSTSSPSTSSSSTLKPINFPYSLIWVSKKLKRCVCFKNYSYS